MGKGFLMCDEIHEWIHDNLPEGSTILELGSGKGTARLAEKYKMFSVEHDKRWMNKYNSTYIYASIKDGWYDVKALRKKLPKHYDLLLVDGPPRKVDGTKVGRKKMSEFMDLFNTNVIMLFDDSDRGREAKLIQAVKDKVGRDYTNYKGRDHRGKGTWFAIFDKVE
ncbi:MAG: hypothetical protein ACTSSP_01420 [Candidatus Asgardarchaeia archaeon]